LNRTSQLYDNIRHEDQVPIIQGFSFAIHHISDYGTHKTCFQKLVSLVCQRIENLLSFKKTVELRTEIANQLKNLTSCFYDKTQSIPSANIQPIVEVLESILPFLNTILKSWEIDSQGFVITEVLTILFEALNTAKKNFPPELRANIINLVVEVYNINPLPIAIKLISKAIDLYDEDENNTYLSSVLNKVSVKTFQVLEGDMKKIDLITEYFELLNIAMLRSPNIIILEHDPSFIPNNALSLGVICLTFSEKEPVFSVLKFLESFNFGIHTQNDQWYSYINSAFEHIGAKLIHNLFIAIIKDIYFLIDMEANLLYLIIKRYRNMIGGLLKEAFPVDNIKDIKDFDLDKFIEILLKVDQPRKFKACIKEFTEVLSGFYPFQQLVDYLLD